MASITPIRYQYDLDLRCPACKQPVYGSAQVELSPKLSAETPSNAVVFSGNITGMKIQHDCIRSTIR